MRAGAGKAVGALPMALERLRNAQLNKDRREILTELFVRLSAAGSAPAASAPHALPPHTHTTLPPLQRFSGPSHIVDLVSQGMDVLLRLLRASSRDVEVTRGVLGLLARGVSGGDDGSGSAPLDPAVTAAAATGVTSALLSSAPSMAALLECAAGEGFGGGGGGGGGGVAGARIAALQLLGNCAGLDCTGTANGILSVAEGMTRLLRCLAPEAGGEGGGDLLSEALVLLANLTASGAPDEIRHQVAFQEGFDALLALAGAQLDAIDAAAGALARGGSGGGGGGGSERAPSPPAPTPAHLQHACHRLLTAADCLQVMTNCVKGTSLAQRMVAQLPPSRLAVLPRALDSLHVCRDLLALSAESGGLDSATLSETHEAVRMLLRVMVNLVGACLGAEGKGLALAAGGSSSSSGSESGGGLCTAGAQLAAWLQGARGSGKGSALTAMQGTLGGIPGLLLGLAATAFTLQHSSGSAAAAACTPKQDTRAAALRCLAALMAGHARNAERIGETLVLQWGGAQSSGSGSGGGAQQPALSLLLTLAARAVCGGGGGGAAAKLLSPSQVPAPCLCPPSGRLCA